MGDVRIWAMLAAVAVITIACAQIWPVKPLPPMRGSYRKPFLRPPPPAPIPRAGKGDRGGS